MWCNMNCNFELLKIVLASIHCNPTHIDCVDWGAMADKDYLDDFAQKSKMMTMVMSLKLDIGQGDEVHPIEKLSKELGKDDRGVEASDDDFS